MILQIVVLIGMIGFCIWQLVNQISTPSSVYIPVLYILCPILLIFGIGKRGVITWPLASILLLIQGHWIVGWIPALLVGFTIIGNDWLKKKYPTDCPMCQKRIEIGQEFKYHRGIYVHAGDCFNALKSELQK